MCRVLRVKKRKKKPRQNVLLVCKKRDVSVNVLPESDRQCPPTSASDCPDSRRERDDAARAASPGSPDRCPPRRQHDSMKTTVEEAALGEATSAADQIQDSADGPQSRRPNPRTTPQLLATKVSSLLLACTRASQYFVRAEFFTTATPPRIHRPIPLGSKIHSRVSCTSACSVVPV